MLAGVIGEALAGELIQFAASAVKKRFKRPPGVTSIDTSHSALAMSQHVMGLGRWANDVSFKGLTKAKSLANTFVNLDLELSEETLYEAPSPNSSRTTVSRLAGTTGHTVIIGDPGAGKTTSLQRLAQIALSNSGHLGTRRIPILVRFRDFRKADTLASYILTTLGVSVTTHESVTAKAKRGLLLQVATDVLQRTTSIIFCDGLDELHPSARDHVVGELRELCVSLDEPRLVLTCRTGDYVYHIARTQVLEIQPLSPTQITDFAERWLGKPRARGFIAKVRATPYSGSEVRPLTLAHLCAIYERSGTVPEKPKTVYKKIVRLLIEEWDEQRSVRRHSRYANFETDRKEEFLEALAFYIAKNFKRASFTHAELRDAYLALYPSFGLPSSQAAKVVREIESHTGLVIETSHEQYEFAHKSLQEYLAANYILKLPSLPGPELFEMPNEMALVVALSSAHGSQFAAIARWLDVDSYVSAAHFAEPFLHRLMLERVDWIVAHELGEAILALYSRAYCSDPMPYATSDPSRGYDAISDFVRIPAVAKSIATVLERSTVVPLTNRRLAVVAGGPDRDIANEYTVDDRLILPVLEVCPNRTIFRLLERQ